MSGVEQLSLNFLNAIVGLKNGIDVIKAIRSEYTQSHPPRYNRFEKYKSRYNKYEGHKYSENYDYHHYKKKDGNNFGYNNERSIEGRKYNSKTYITQEPTRYVNYSTPRDVFFGTLV